MGEVSGVALKFVESRKARVSCAGCYCRRGFALSLSREMSLIAVQCRDRAFCYLAFGLEQ